MLNQRKLNPLDKLITNADNVLKTLFGESVAKRPSPADDITEDKELSAEEKKHVAGLMRVNHSGEVCAQALYQGQAFTAKLGKTRQAMEQAAEEEEDHLAWCANRIKDFDSHTSVLNPLWYGMSFCLGAAAGIAGDKVSLGFVAATEEQVGKHLSEHLDLLPENDKKSRAIIEQMHKDETQHAENAKAAGGLDFPTPIKQGMSLISKFMTQTSYKI